MSMCVRGLSWQMIQSMTASASVCAGAGRGEGVDGVTGKDAKGVGAGTGVNASAGPGADEAAIEASSRAALRIRSVSPWPTPRWLQVMSSTPSKASYARGG